MLRLNLSCKTFWKQPKTKQSENETIWLRRNNLVKTKVLKMSHLSTYCLKWQDSESLLHTDGLKDLIHAFQNIGISLSSSLDHISR